MPRTVLITGATGTVGGRLARSLASVSDLRVRALVRNPEATDLGGHGIELHAGSFEEAASLAAAVRGVDTVVLITPANERAADQAHAVLEYAREAGVRKVVRLSAIKAAADGPTDNTRQHARTELELRESGLAFVALRPQIFMQNLLGSASAVVDEGKLYSGIGEGRVGLIDTRDVADCLAEAVLRSDFDGRALELTGPTSISHADVAAALGEAMGRPVEYVPIEPEVAAQAMGRFGASDWMIRLMTDYMRAYRSGFGDFVSDAVETMTGRPPRDITAFAREVFAPFVSRTEGGGR